MTEIYLIRHAQAEGNLYRAMQGHWDGDVTALGLRQIDALSARFAGVRVDALYSSDLKRAMLTAGAIARLPGAPALRTDPDLREINVGPWEARFFADAAHEQPDKMDLFIDHAEEFRLDGAESYHDVRRRAAAALERIARENDGRTVAVVSHGVTIRCLLSHMLRRSLDDPSLPICGNTGVTHLFFEDGSFRIDYINDCAHLAALALPERERTPNLRGETIDPAAETDYYSACYTDAWQTVHGTLRGFSPRPYLDAACRHHQSDPGAVIKIYDGDEPVGLVDMDSRRGEHANYGWISLLYLSEGYRGRGMGVQLLGRALMHYRIMGRAAVRLHVAEKNTAALRFYTAHGFRRLSSEDGGFGRTYLMEYRFGESHV